MMFDIRSGTAQENKGHIDHHEKLVLPEPLPILAKLKYSIENSICSHVCQTIWKLFAATNNHAQPRQFADTAAASTTGVTGPAASRASRFLGRSETIPRQTWA